jgi:hypothetical protein
VMSHSVSCLPLESDLSIEDPPSRSIIIGLSLFTLGLEREMPVLSLYSEKCGLECLKALHNKIVQIARNNLEKLFQLQSKSYAFLN